MPYPKKLSIEQKIKMIREFRGIDIHEFAASLGCSESTVKRYENPAETHEKFTYDNDQLILIKKVLGIEGAPLYDEDYAPFKRKMYSWLASMRDDDGVKVDALQKELEVILSIPYHHDLMLLYLIFEAKWLLRKEKQFEADAKMKLVETELDTVTNEVLYEFNYTMGTLNVYKKRYEEALNYYLEAGNLEIDSFDKGTVLDYNIALCYSEIGKYMSAITSLERTYHIRNYNRPNHEWVGMSNMVALNYMRLDDIDKAKKIFERALQDAVSINNEFYIETILHNLGCTHFRAKDYKLALEYFGRVGLTIQENNRLYLEYLYFKSCCLVALRRREVEELISHGISISKEKNDETFALLFESLTLLPFLKEEESRNFIEYELIPRLISEYKYFKAIFYCEQLRGYYVSASRKQKVFEMDSVMLDISKKMTK